MDNLQPIPTPLPVLLRRIRYRVLPLLTLVICSTAAFWLWSRQGAVGSATAEVNAIRMNANAKVDGVLVEIPRSFAVFDTVSKGEVVARLDGKVIQAQIARMQEELNSLRNDRDAILKRAMGSATRPSSRPAVINPTEEVEDDGIDLTDVNLAPEFVQQLSALRLAIRSHVGRIAELQQRLESLEVRSPIEGTVIEVHRRPGQAVTAGGPVLTIAARDGQYIVSYVRQNPGITPRVGMVAHIRPRAGGTSVKSYVTHVGPQVDKIPDTQLRDVKIPEWGTPVHIAIPTRVMTTRPGELLDVTFRRGETMIVQAFLRDSDSVSAKSLKPGSRVRIETSAGTSGAQVLDVGGKSDIPAALLASAGAPEKGVSVTIALDDPAADLTLTQGELVDVVFDGKGKVKGLGM